MDLQRIFWWCMIMGVLIAGIEAKAELKLSNIFSDNMVLQRDMPVPVWGKASPGKKVTVKFKGQTVSSKANIDGKWTVKLAPLKTDSNPTKMTVISGTEKKSFDNILVGEVWLCSGQSNMQSSFAGLKMTKEVEGVDSPLIRLSYGNKWTACVTNNLKRFSCVGYYFGLKLRQELNVPIGLLNISRGCSSIEAWMTPGSLAANDFLKDKLAEMKKFQKFHSNYKQSSPEEKERVFLEHCNSRYIFARNFLENGKLKPDKYKTILSHMTVIKPAFLYNSLIVPVVPFAIRGVIWYQGETNVEDRQYALKQQILAESWRKIWGEGDFPFYLVQIAPFKGYPNLPEFWLQQYEAVRKTKNSGLVSTVDIGDINECHPINKSDVGMRLELLALRDTYGKKDVVASGPTFKSVKFVDNRIIVSFENCGSGLTTKNGKAPDWFEVAGADGKFFKAKAKIVGNTVEASNAKAKTPKYVRYGWNHIAEPNLRNKENLPAFPFNTAKAFFQHKK
jgi:sialate O-acetylesterase